MKLALPRYVIAGLATAGLAVAGFWTVLIACADYYASQTTVAGTEKALALMPGRSSYYYQLALLVTGRDPDRAVRALHRAVALTPGDYLSWIELGLHAEMDGDIRQAERDLSRAAEVDNEFLPKWTLANFYSRRGDEARFWLWAKPAAQMLYGDPLPLFRLCGAVAEDGKLLDRLEIRSPEIQAAYISYLLNRKRADLAKAAAPRLIEWGRPENVPLLLAVCDQLLSGGDVDGALAIWNSMAAKKSISSPPFLPEAKQVFASDSFTAPALSQGFDWRLPSLEGLSVSREESPAGLRFSFSGRQPEECEPLSRLVPIQEGAGYEFGIRYRTEGIQPNTGLILRITDATSGALLAASGSLASENDATAALSFTAPAGCRLARIALAYKRAAGTIRIEGSIALREAALKRARLH